SSSSSVSIAPAGSEDFFSISIPFVPQSGQCYFLPPFCKRGGSNGISAERQKLQRILQQFLQILDEARGVPAIDDAVVAGEREVHPLADDDLAVQHDRLLLDLVDRDDRDLGAVDDRR